MIVRRVLSDDAAAKLIRALAVDAFAAGVTLVIEDCRSTPWSSATFEGVQVHLVLTAATADAARPWLAGLDEAELRISGHVAMAPAVDAVTVDGDALAVSMTVLVLIDG